MQDFLTDRPVVAAEAARIVNLAPPPPSPDGAAGLPFARIVAAAAVPAPEHAERCGPRVGSDAAGSETAARARPQVRTEMKDGRVTRIIVTCACGQVTEIDCVY